MKKYLKLAAAGALLIGSAIVATVSYVQFSQMGRIRSSDQAPAAEAILTLGASVLSDGTPSDALRDRLLTALALYKDGKAPKILITGDDGAYRVDEIDVMRRFLQQQGVPDSDILADGQGYRTYESCKRAARVFGIRRAIVVTQRFHLGRALFLCQSFGIESAGVAADLNSYRDIAYFWARDLTASAVAWWDVNVLEPAPPADGVIPKVSDPDTK